MYDKVSTPFVPKMELFVVAEMKETAQDKERWFKFIENPDV